MSHKYGSASIRVWGRAREVLYRRSPYYHPTQEWPLHYLTNVSAKRHAELFIYGVGYDRAANDNWTRQDKWNSSYYYLYAWRKGRKLPNDRLAAYQRFT